MAIKTWSIDKWTGGLSEGSKTGYEGSFRDLLGLDFVTDPDTLTSTRALKKDSGTTVVDLVKWICEINGIKYMYGNAGHLYSKSGSTYTDLRTVSNSHGNGLCVFGDYLYYAYDKGFGRYGLLSGTPAFEDAFLESVTNQTDQTLNTTGSTYTLGTSVSETSTHLQTFTAGVNNIIGVALNIDTIGSGNWTVVIHDTSNAVIAQITIPNGSLSTGLVRFIFSGKYTLTVGNAYHIHCYSSVGDGKVVTTSSNDLETAEFSTLQYVVVEDIDQSLDPNSTTGINSYTIPTAISEAVTARQSFIPDKVTQTAISVVFREIGAGDVTLTVHDEFDTVITSKTIANASLKLGGFNKFIFTAPWTAEVGATYHFHLTTSTGSAETVEVTTVSDLETASFHTHYQVLETDTNWHPMMYFPASQSMLIGNGRFCASYDGIAYRGVGQNEGSERLVFSKEESVRAFATVGDYAAIATWKGTNIYDQGESTIYFWDGVSPSYNNFKTVIGEVNAMVTGTDGLLYVIHGGFGYISIFDGSLTLVHKINLIGRNKYIEVFPGAITIWDSRVFFGISNGDSTTSTRVLYSFGRKSKSFKRVLNKESAISTGHTTGTTLQIGAVKGIGPAELYVSWKDNTTYGVDVIDVSNDQATSYFETRIFDAEEVYQEKKGYAIKANFEKLTDGQTIKIEYKIDRASWADLGTISYSNTESGVNVRKSFPFDKRFYEVELKVTLTAASGVAPKLISIATYYETNPDIQEN